jgi:hypothetical protein
VPAGGGRHVLGGEICVLDEIGRSDFPAPAGPSPHVRPFGCETAHSDPALAIDKKIATKGGLFHVAVERAAIVGAIMAGSSAGCSAGAPSAMPNSAGRSLEAVEAVEVLDSLPGDLLELFQPVEADNG